MTGWWWCGGEILDPCGGKVCMTVVVLGRYYRRNVCIGSGDRVTVKHVYREV